MGLDNLSFCAGNNDAMIVERKRMELVSSASDGKFLFFEGSICDREFVNGLFERYRFTHVAHQAAVASVPRSMRDPPLYSENNIHGMFVLLSSMRSLSPASARLVFASSSSVHGDGGGVLSPYALSKRVNEETIEMFSRVFGMSLFGLRYFNVFGPGQRDNDAYSAVIPKFLRAAKIGESLKVFGDGEQSRAFTYIDDVVQANLHVLYGASSLRPGQTTDCGNTTSTTVNQLVDLVCDQPRDLDMQHVHPAGRHS